VNVNVKLAIIIAGQQLVSSLIISLPQK